MVVCCFFFTQEAFGVPLAVATLVSDLAAFQASVIHFCPSKAGAGVAKGLTFKTLFHLGHLFGSAVSVTYPESRSDFVSYCRGDVDVLAGLLPFAGNGHCVDIAYFFSNGCKYFIICSLLLNVTYLYLGQFFKGDRFGIVADCVLQRSGDNFPVLRSLLVVKDLRWPALVMSIPVKFALTACTSLSALTFFSMSVNVRPSA